MIYICNNSFNQSHFCETLFQYSDSILVTKTTAAQNEVALSYHRVHGVNFLAVVFTATVVPREISDLYIKGALLRSCLGAHL